MAAADPTSRPDDTQAEGEVHGESQRPVRRPYTAPKLKHLGSVRDLTLGASNLAGEGGMRMM